MTTRTYLIIGLATMLLSVSGIVIWQVVSLVRMIRSWKNDF